MSTVKHINCLWVIYSCLLFLCLWYSTCLHFAHSHKYC
uniref:Uncharacterized protein n=1 Tax=Anguilla anguilla TaxID=7936 RepID=A0A0E9TA46_ANGAN